MKPTLVIWMVIYAVLAALAVFLLWPRPEPEKITYSATCVKASRTVDRLQDAMDCMDRRLASLKAEVDAR